VTEPSLVEPLLDWFKKEARDLPWRKTYDPYHVWISEIMLQQTQMDRGVGYFLRWIAQLPEVESVASAPLQEVLKLWEGLGYYARARNLHKAAKIIVNDFGGVVPCASKTLIRLPGIGPYTAAAIASIAGDENIPAIDANVCRVFARVFDIDTPVSTGEGRGKIEELSWTFLPAGKANQYNQAVMELGGTLCTPKSPKCALCPLRKRCQAFEKKIVDKRPVQVKKRATVKILRFAGLIRWQDKIYIQQRRVEDLWGSLWDLPGMEFREEETCSGAQSLLKRAIRESTGLVVTVGEQIVAVKHQYTNHRVTLLCYECEIKSVTEPEVLKTAGCHNWISSHELDQYGFPAGARKVISHLKEQKILFSAQG